MARSPDKLTCGWEKLAVLLAEANALDLISEYWEELSLLEGIPFDVDWDRMARGEAAGVFKIWAARVNGTLAGFASFWIEPYIFARTTVFAIDGGHFLSPAFRDKGRVGYRMWTSLGVGLKAEGVKMALLHDNTARALMPFFLAIGAEPRSTWFWWDLR